MPISIDLIHDLAAVLVNCPAFGSSESLRAVFVAERLYPWRDSISETAVSRTARVSALISDLVEQANDQGENALVLFVRVLLDGEYVAPGTADHRKLQALLPELDRALSPARPAQGAPAGPGTPPVIPDPPEPMMDRETEVEAFAEVAMGRDAVTHLILVHGASGMGKTALLDRYRQVAEAVELDYLDFNMATQLSIAACMRALVGHLDTQHFPRYMDALGAPPPSPVSRDAEARWHQQLATQFFRDLGDYSAAPRQLLLVDQYEKADPAFKTWFTESFLPLISPTSPLIVVVAGQEALSPQPSGRHWRHFHLKGVTIDWYFRYAEAWGVELSPHDIRILYEMSRGCPRDFVFLIKGRAAGGAA